VRTFAPLLLLLACRPAPAETAKPAPAEKPSALAGFDGPVADPVADEATRLGDGPLVEAAAREAPGAALVGDLIAGRIAPGQVVEQEFRLEPGRCYTLVAVGGEGVRELDATLERLAPVRGKSAVLASDTRTGGVAVVGAGDDCLRWGERAAVAGRFVLRVRDGEGVVVSQLYAR
jgi:hypothetical protein